MRIFGKRVVLLSTEYNDSLREAEKRGKDWGSRSSKQRIEELETNLERKTKELNKKDTQLTETKEKLEVYEEERDKVRDIVKQQIANDDLESALDSRKDALDTREARLKDRENVAVLEEDKRYKAGYADGVADGVRKISEVTQKDRDNAMKVAMVAAASHTDPRIVQEINSVSQLAAGTEDSEE